MRIALVNNQAFTVWQFRRGLIQELVSRGVDVTVITPPGPFIDRIETLGARHLAVPFEQYVNLGSDIRLLSELYRVYCRERFDLVHNITIKPNIFSTFAASLARVPRIVGLVPGLGHMYADQSGLRHQALRETVTSLYRLAFCLNRRVWFQNEDDLSFFVSKRVVSRSKAVLIRGSGVDLQEYSPSSVDQRAVDALRQELNIGPGTMVASMMARAYWSKGVREFVDAAHQLGHTRDVRFLLVGSIEHGPDAVPAEFLHERFSSQFQWLGFRTDVRELLALSNVVTLPSYYREGIPRTLLEALAMAKPVITTDSVGCREVVDHGRNGYLIPPRDVSALCEAIARFVNQPTLQQQFGHYSRQKAEREFGEQIVIQKVLSELYGF